MVLNKDKLPIKTREILTNPDLLNYYLDKISKFAYYHSREFQSTEDITQEVFLYLCQHPDQYDSTRGSIESYLFTVTSSRAKSYLRAKKRHSNTSLDMTLIDPTTGKVNLLKNTIPEEDLTHNLDSDDIKRANVLAHYLAEQSAACPASPSNSALFFKSVYGKKYPEIQKILNISLGTVSSSINHMRKRIKRKFPKTHRQNTKH
jgi:RNA polymerase sigma factor (sigma-70 family)